MLKDQKFGDVYPGTAVVDKQTGETLYKVSTGLSCNAINVDSLQASEQAKIITMDRQREVRILSEQVTLAIKAHILNTPGYRGLKL